MLPLPLQRARTLKGPRHAGYREMQGFLFSPALDADDFAALLREGLPIRK